MWSHKVGQNKELSGNESGRNSQESVRKDVHCKIKLHVTKFLSKKCAILETPHKKFTSHQYYESGTDYIARTVGCSNHITFLPNFRIFTLPRACVGLPC